MADLNKVFKNFNQFLSLTTGRRDRIISSRKAVEDSIIRYFKDRDDLSTPKFFIQGSYKMSTMILNKDNTYDVDLAVIFEGKPSITPKTLQKHVAEAVRFHTDSGVEHKQKCVRVIYRGEFNIGLPVYYIEKRTTYFATKSGWEKSDPKKLVEWFMKKKDSKGQLLRIVKYLKAWANKRSFKMPSGIALTVWAAKNYKTNERDDLALLNTLKAIRSSLRWEVKCINPVTPKDDLVSKLDKRQKEKFVEALKLLIEDMQRAKVEKNETKAYNILKKHFGDRFLL
jgi:hypothetical protein